MPTSSYMPNLVVEIAFNAGFATPAASRTYTDVSDYVELAEGLSITYGRQDERSTADANQLTLTLDNRDGRFTPGRSSSPYYPNVKLDRPIRVTATPVDGAASTRFVGFINEWPVEWEGSDGYAKVSITASSRLARLGTVAGLKSIVEMAILADSPLAYYTLAEPPAAVFSNDASGKRASSLVVTGDPALPIVYGTATGPGTDSLTAAQFNGGQFLQGTLPGALTIETFFLRTGAPTGVPETIFDFGDGAILLTIGTDGLLYLNGVAKSTASVADDATHHLAVTLAVGPVVTPYLDGVALATSAIPLPTTSTFRVGGPTVLGLLASYPLTGVLAHVAAFTSILSAAQIAAHSAAGLTGFAGETTSARLLRYTGYAGIPSTEVSAETGQTTVQHIDTTDKQAVELMRVMETTEGGVLFDGRDGLVNFQNRTHRLASAALYTLDMAQQMVESDYSPKLDRTAIANDITAADVSGAYTAHVFDATGKLDNGVATLTIETASTAKDEPLFLASWALYRYKTPLPRVASLSVDALAQVGKTPNCSAVMATNVGDKVTVSNRPSQDSTSSASFFVEGYSEVYGPESLRFTFNVSPSSPDDTTLIIGDSTGRGVIGTNPVAL